MLPIMPSSGVLKRPAATDIAELELSVDDDGDANIDDVDGEPSEGSLQAFDLFVAFKQR